GRGMTISVLQALDDPRLLASHFKGPSWQPWRAFLACLFAIPLSEDQLALYRLHTAREAAPTQAFVEACLVCGRRSGKSRTLSVLGVFLAAFRDYTPHLAPGEKATVALIS